MMRWGVWTEDGGGFVSDADYTRKVAEDMRAYLIAEAAPEDQQEAADDMTVVAMCNDHDGQPEVGCEDCDAEDAETDDDEEDEDAA
jgi:hypothetical protein